MDVVQTTVVVEVVDGRAPLEKGKQKGWKDHQKE